MIPGRAIEQKREDAIDFLRSFCDYSNREKVFI